MLPKINSHRSNTSKEKRQKKKRRRSSPKLLLNKSLPEIESLQNEESIISPGKRSAISLESNLILNERVGSQEKRKKKKQRRRKNKD